MEREYPVPCFSYDYRTRRIGVSNLVESTAFSYTGGLSVAEYAVSGLTGPLDETATPLVEYSRGPDMGGGIGGLLYSLRDGQARFNLSNGRGDIVAQSNMAGVITWSASYEGFGTRQRETGSNSDRHRANSKEEDPTGLLHEHFRYRDLETGVWLSRDPAGFVDGPNLYAYVSQNPWTSFDPLGLEKGKKTGWKERTVRDLEDAGDDGKDAAQGFQELQKQNRDLVSSGKAIADGAETLTEAVSLVAAGSTVLTGKGAAGVTERSGMDRTLNAAGIVPFVKVADVAVDVVRTGKAAESIVESARPLAKAPSELVEDTPRGTGNYRDVKEHHPHAKKAFEGAVGYDEMEAFSVSKDLLQEYGVRHATITGRQKRLFQKFAASGAPNTLTHHSRIAYLAMVESGIPSPVAREWVKKSQSQLIRSGVVEPTVIPWGGK